MSKEKYYPRWAKEIKRFCSIRSQFILWGNIYDIFPIMLNDRGTNRELTLELNDYIAKMLEEEYYEAVVSFEPKYGMKLLMGSEDKIKQTTGQNITKQEYFQCEIKDATILTEKIVTNRMLPTGLILNFSSRYSELDKNNISEMYYRIFRLSMNSKPIFNIETKNLRYNLIFWIMDNFNDLPNWYNLGNYRIKSLNIPKPDYETRKIIISLLSAQIEGFKEMDNEKAEEINEIFINQTSDLQGQEILSIVSIAHKEKIPFGEIGEAIRRYKLGIEENPWAKLNIETIKSSENILKKDVFGQDYAISKTSDIIKRSVFNLSGSQYSAVSQRPKGVLFFAGPTGVGKTELAKSITKLIFGSETSYIRFDMSEFSKEHADQRLIGAPPGYTGYDNGGELINAIKAKPFSVILFDEIEKAHSKILDIFLQILDDGRLTSGRGELAYFSEALIIFTSNLGVYEKKDDGTRIQRISPEMKYEDIDLKIKEAIDDYFKYQIMRAEILNRIGKNIVVFDFIRKEVARNIIEKMIKRVTSKLMETKKIELCISENVLDIISNEATSDLSMGGRGIGNVIEEVFINSLSRALFEVQAIEGNKIKIVDLKKDNNRWNMILTK